MRKIIAITVIILWLLPGTVLGAFGAIGQKANYADAWPTIEYEIDNTIAVGVHDQRPYVINGEKSPTYTGTARGGYGIPWNVNTESDKPLSEDIASALVSGLKRVGSQAASVPISFSDNHQSALEKLKQLGTKRIVIITLREWRSDTYRNVGFFVDTVIQVYNEEGKEIAISSAFHNNIGFRDVSVDSPEAAAGLHLSKLLNDPKVKAILAYKLTDREKQIVLNNKPAIVTAIETGKDGRFIAYNNETVIDTETGLMWAAEDNRSDINWNDAKKYCENYRWGGYKDWRMPTQEELAGLYDKNKRYKAACEYYVFLTPLIRLTCTWVWAAETRGSEGASFDFNPGYRNWRPPADTGARNWTEKSESYYGRVLPVRSGK